MTRILIVDDIEENRYLLESLLASKGYGVLTAKNGAEALLRLPGPDVIISDILMPTMDGYELCRRVRLDPRISGLPFIFYTATYTSDEDRKFALDLGADLFLVKPMEPEAFIREFEVFLSSKRGMELIESQAPEDRHPTTLRDDRTFIRRHERVLFDKLEKKLSELESANKDLIAERDFSETVMNSILDRIAVIDQSGKIASVNRAWRDTNPAKQALRFLALQAGEQFTVPDSELDPSRRIAKACTAVANGARASYSEEVPSPDGEAWLTVRAAPLHGSVGGALVSVADISERKRAELSAINHARKSETLLKELFHRTRNNLQLVSSLLKLYSGEAGESAAQLASKMEIRIESLRIIQDKLYESNTMRQVNFRAYIEDLFMFLYSDHTRDCAKIDLNLSMDEFKLDVETATPIGLILAELIANSIAHAFGGRERGTVTVAARKVSDEMMELTVSDNGKGGMPDELPLLGMSGLRLVRELAENQLGGDWSIRSGNGSAFTLRFPLRQDRLEPRET